MTDNNTNSEGGRQTFTRQQLDGMTAAEYVEAVGGLNSTVFTFLQLESQGLRSRYPTLFAAPVKRELKEATGRALDGVGIKKLEMNLISMLLYVAGVSPEKSCRHRVKETTIDHCQTFWDGCIVAPEGPMKMETRRRPSTPLRRMSDMQHTNDLDKAQDRREQHLSHREERDSDLEEDNNCPDSISAWRDKEH
ncbi:hypothetical protein PFICI_09037 [Pestalotiopsis fici W106-1]|uniref:Uncharacterized protein n=1 Tax=Pestalotiopsis fici (strain W106-1 / CGMCC3.15140) TaxID=1229662 RepID=W3WZG8_PESFW|nr:uncharacterized protein PFICI_09037 [Pestalotiopsis fici W106-1]ETS79184.1 hypothetical protein PFICI_09037 [Pestalotiopsis fici W106-1]